jgi:hypothetical protein
MTIFKVSIYLTFALAFLKLVGILNISWMWVMSPILFLILTLIGISILALIIITLTIKIIKKIKQ